MIPWPYALACVLCAVAWAVWLLWRQRLERRALHAQLVHLNAALRQLEVLGVMPVDVEGLAAIAAQQKAYEAYVQRDQAAYLRWQQGKMP